METPEPLLSNPSLYLTILRVKRYSFYVHLECHVLVLICVHCVLSQGNTEGSLASLSCIHQATDISTGKISLIFLQAVVPALSALPRRRDAPIHHVLLLLHFLQYVHIFLVLENAGNTPCVPHQC